MRLCNSRLTNRTILIKRRVPFVNPLVMTILRVEYDVIGISFFPTIPCVQEIFSMQ